MVAAGVLVLSSSHLIIKEFCYQKNPGEALKEYVLFLGTDALQRVLIKLRHIFVVTCTYIYLQIQTSLRVFGNKSPTVAVEVRS